MKKWRPKLAEELKPEPLAAWLLFPLPKYQASIQVTQQAEAGSPFYC